MDFQFHIPLKKSGEEELVGLASTLSIDRDEERMSEKALRQMVEDIKNSGINLFGNHEHQWENTLGIIKDASYEDGKVFIKVALDDATTNPKVPMMLNKLAKGINLGLSVGGAVTDEKWEYSTEKKKKIKTIDGVKLYEISVVGIPANPDAYISIPSQILKSMKDGHWKWVQKCPMCLAEMDDGNCDICLYKEFKYHERKVVG